jgi:hypothetical protein
VNVKVLCQKKVDASEERRAFDFDPDLRSVLELATDSELCEIQTILFGPRCGVVLFLSYPFLVLIIITRINNNNKCYPFHQLLESFAEIHHNSY